MEHLLNRPTAPVVVLPTGEKVELLMDLVYEHQLIPENSLVVFEASLEPLDYTQECQGLVLLHLLLLSDL